jgi:hypothetical protein
VYARKVSADDIEQNIKNNKGGNGFSLPNFPSMGYGYNNNTTLPAYTGPPEGSGFMGNLPPSAFNYDVNNQSQFDPRSANLNDLFKMMGQSINQNDAFNNNRR